MGAQECPAEHHHWDLRLNFGTKTISLSRLSTSKLTGLTVAFAISQARFCGRRPQNRHDLLPDTDDNVGELGRRPVDAEIEPPGELPADQAMNTGSDGTLRDPANVRAPTTRSSAVGSLSVTAHHQTSRRRLKRLHEREDETWRVCWSGQPEIPDGQTTGLLRCVTSRHPLRCFFNIREHLHRVPSIGRDSLKEPSIPEVSYQDGGAFEAEDAYP